MTNGEKITELEKGLFQLKIMIDKEENDDLKAEQKSCVITAKNEIKTLERLIPTNTYRKK